jgi:rhodanese-related sulfurtransferase
MLTGTDRDEVRRLVEEEAAHLVEVLPRAKYEWSHLAGALHLHLKEMDRSKVSATLDASRPVIVDCYDYQ